MKTKKIDLRFSKDVFSNGNNTNDGLIYNFADTISLCYCLQQQKYTDSKEKFSYDKKNKPIVK